MRRSYWKVVNVDRMVENLVVYVALLYFLGSVLRMFDDWTTWQIARMPLVWVGTWMTISFVAWLLEPRHEG